MLVVKDRNTCKHNASHHDDDCAVANDDDDNDGKREVMCLVVISLPQATIAISTEVLRSGLANIGFENCERLHCL